MAKKKNELSFEEKLKNALVPEEEQPYQIPENWVWTRLGEVFEWGSGGTPPRKEKENFEGKIPWFKTGELNNEYLYNSEERITQRALDNSSAKLYPPNTVIMAMYGATIGKLGILSVDGTTNQACACAKPNKYVLVKYLFFYLMSRKEDFIKKGKGGAQPNISQEIIKEYKFPLSPFQEQERIVERIESLFLKLDEAKEKIQMSLDSFENRKSAILYKAFSGELTKKWREENGISLDDWNNGTLQSVCSIKITDGTHQTPKYTSEENGIPFLSAKDIVTGKIKWDKIKYITEELHEELYKRVTPQKEDLLLAKNGTTGIAAIVEDDKIFDIYVTLALLRADYKKVFYRFLYYLINSPICKEQFNSKLTGIGVPNLHLRDIRNVEIVYPSLEEQKEIVCILDTIFEKEQDIQQLIDLIEKIDLMKKSILARAFRGELGTNLPEEENAIELLKSVLEV